MPADHRSQWMLEHDEALDDAQRQMVDLADLVNLQDGGVALGLHGKSPVSYTHLDVYKRQIGAMFSFGLYQPHVRQGRFDFALRLFASFIFGGVLLTVLYYLLPFLYVGRGVL